MSPTPEPGSLWQQFNVGCWDKRQKGSTEVMGIAGAGWWGVFWS